MIDRGRKKIFSVSPSDAVDYEYAVAKIIEDAQRGEPVAVRPLRWLCTESSQALWIAPGHRYRLNNLRPCHSRWSAGALGVEPSLRNQVERPRFYRRKKMMIKVCGEAASRGYTDLLLWQSTGDTRSPRPTSGRSVPGAPGGGGRAVEVRYNYSCWQARDRRPYPQV